MKKQTFISIIKAIQAQQAQERNFCEDLDKYLDGNFISIITTDFVSSIVNALKSEMGDHPSNSLIEWWLWDTPNGGNNPDNSYIDGDHRHWVRTPGELWKYLNEFGQNWPQVETAKITVDRLIEILDDDLRGVL